MIYTTDLQVLPFPVPTSAQVTLPKQVQVDVVGVFPRPEPVPSYWLPLGELSARQISELCDEFRREVFLRAGKRDPREEEEE
jgi:hypothetical protein